MAGITDVASKAGVSVSTVSHVLNKTRYVAPKTKAKVEAAVEALGYVPSTLARALKTNRTHTLGMLVSNSTNPFFADIVRGVEEGCFEFGYHLILCNSDDNAERQRTYLRTLAMRRVDGLIVMTTHGDPSFDRSLGTQSDLPMVVLDADEMPNVCVLGDNSVLGGRLATEFLISRGFRRIAIISGPSEHPRARDRRNGTEQALQEAGLTLPAHWIMQGDLTASGGHRAMSDFLDACPESDWPDAVFAFNDLMAIGAIRSLQERGINVPGNISVVGYDDIELASYMTPSLTTLRQPGFEFGFQSAKLLIDHLDKQQKLPSKFVRNPQLIVRESVGKKPAETS